MHLSIVTGLPGGVHTQIGPRGGRSRRSRHHKCPACQRPPPPRLPVRVRSAYGSGSVAAAALVDEYPDIRVFLQLSGVATG